MELKPAKSSPRLENNILKWYLNDSFSIEWSFSLTWDEEPYMLDENDELIFSFFKFLEKEPVHTFSFTNVQDNSVSLDFTEEISKKFTPGVYTYCVKLNTHDGPIVTLYAKQRAEVEKCH